MRHGDRSEIQIPSAKPEPARGTAHETVDALVVAGESFEDTPPKVGPYGHDLRPPSRASVRFWLGS
ncbi:hypothetical protein [Streptomyces sp. NPDC000133]|uniref:hypothetical protein n=1 Tax=Streptomyces sp. NPDC000133 TaxID=3364535 RepID=UPI00369CE2E0